MSSTDTIWKKEAFFIVWFHAAGKILPHKILITGKSNITPYIYTFVPFLSLLSIFLSSLPSSLCLSLFLMLEMTAKHPSPRDKISSTERVREKQDDGGGERHSLSVLLLQRSEELLQAQLMFWCVLYSLSITNTEHGSIPWIYSLVNNSFPYNKLTQTIPLSNQK